MQTQKHQIMDEPFGMKGELFKSDE